LACYRKGGTARPGKGRKILLIETIPEEKKGKPRRDEKSPMSVTAVRRGGRLAKEKPMKTVNCLTNPNTYKEDLRRGEGR